MRASRAAEAHFARLHQTAVTGKLRKPDGNLFDSHFQWGTVESIQGVTLTIYPDGSQFSSEKGKIPNIPWVSSYYPTVGDVVLVERGRFLNRTSRVVLGKLFGAASPSGIPLPGIDSAGRWAIGPNMIWGGAGAPHPELGQVGDPYYRTDTPDVVGQRQYVKTSLGWIALNV